MDEPRIPFDRPAILLLTGLLLAVGGIAAPTDGRADDARPEVFGRRIVLQGTATQMFQHNLESLLKECQRQAIESGNDADSILVIEVHKGRSSAGQVLDVVTLLLKREYSRVHTVAWIPKKEDVRGNNTIVALACHDVIMHPSAQLGDIGNGKAAPEYVQTVVKNLAAERRNPELHPAVARGMLDPQVAIKKVTIVTTKDGKPRREDRIVDDDELRDLKKRNVEIPDPPIVLKDAGESGSFTGAKAAADGMLILRTAKNLEQVGMNYNVPQRDLRKTTVATGEDKKVALIRVKGEINSVVESFLIRQIDRCEREHYNLIIFEITASGGLIKPSLKVAVRISELDPEIIRTVAFVPRQALNGAAIVALACDEVYLPPNATIGKINPFDDDRDKQRANREEDLRPLKNDLSSIAERKHRPPALLQAMADRDLVVYRAVNKNDAGHVTYKSETELRDEGDAWVNGGIIPESEKGSLLTLTGKRALELSLADGIIEGKSEKEQMRALKAHLGLSPDMKLVPLEPTWVDTMVFWLNDPWVTGALFVIAIVCIYLELHITTGLLGIIATLCFALFFWSHILGGTAGWLEVILFLLGLACIAIEIFVIPGFGVFGISGGILVISSLVLASQTFGNIEPSADMDLLAGTLGRLAISIVLVVAVAMALSRYLPNMSLFNKLVLAPPGQPDDTAASGPQLHPDFVDGSAALVGRHGETISVLRPAGKARIDGHLIDVVSDGPYVPAGSDVEVVSVAGNRIVVRPV